MAMRQGNLFLILGTCMDDDKCILGFGMDGDETEKFILS